MNLKAQLRPHRTAKAPSTFSEPAFTWPTIQRKQACKGSLLRGADFLAAARRLSVTPGAPRYPLAFFHFGYKGSVLCLTPPRSQPGGQGVKGEPFIWDMIWEAAAGKGEEDEKRRQPRKGLLGSCGQMELNPARELWETGWKTARSCPAKELGSWGICLPTHTISHCGGELGGQEREHGGINLLAFPACSWCWPGKYPQSEKTCRQNSQMLTLERQQGPGCAQECRHPRLVTQGCVKREKAWDTIPSHSAQEPQQSEEGGP